MRNVLCFGEVLWDAFGEEKKAGGAPMNVARHLVQQQVDVLFASRVGTDEPGIGLSAFLKDNGLYSSLIQHDNNLPTCEVTVQLDEDHQATYIIPEPVSWDNIQPEAALMNNAKNAAAIVFGSLACRHEVTYYTLSALLAEPGPLKIFDVNLRPPHYHLITIEKLAAKADMIKMNEEEANLLIPGDHLLEDKIREFQKKFHCQTICITRGARGAIIWHNGEFYEHGGYKVRVQDTVGAGDAFLATLIAGLLNNVQVAKVLKKACAVGAFVASQRGANPLYDQEIINMLIRQGDLTD
jgi:fructokinase